MLADFYGNGVSIDSPRDVGGDVEQTSVTSFSTDLGWMAIAWHDDVLVGNAFGHSSQRLAELALARISGMTPAFCHRGAKGQVEEVPAWVRAVEELLRRFADGEPVDFAEVPLSLEHLTPFGKRVIAACRRITWGQRRSYGELATECGSPGAARAVGSVMAKNRYPLIVPCHRVLGAGGSLGGYSAPQGLKMKRRLLGMEREAMVLLSK